MHPPSRGRGCGCGFSASSRSEAGRVRGIRGNVPSAWASSTRAVASLPLGSWWPVPASSACASVRASVHRLSCPRYSSIRDKLRGGCGFIWVGPDNGFCRIKRVRGYPTGPLGFECGGRTGVERGGGGRSGAGGRPGTVRRPRLCPARCNFTKARSARFPRSDWRIISSPTRVRPPPPLK